MLWVEKFWNWNRKGKERKGKHVARRLANLLEKRVARQLANLLAKQLAKSEEKNALVF